MNTYREILKALIVGAAALATGAAQADIIKHFVRLGAYPLTVPDSYVPLTTSGVEQVKFSGGGKFTIWYTAECAASGYVDVDIWVDGIPLAPTGGDEDSFCDFETRGGMHTVTARTGNLADSLHTVEIWAHKADGLASLSDSSLLIGK